MRHVPHLTRLLRDDRAWAVAIAVVAVVVRVKLLPGLLDDPALAMPLLDSHEYLGLAYSFLQEGWVRLSNHTPLYPIALALSFTLFGVSTVVVALVQYGAGALAASATFLLASRLVDRTAAVVAGVLVATYWFLIYVQSWLYAESLSLVLNLVLLLWLVWRSESVAKYAVAGLLLGFSVLCRPDIFMFVVTILWWLVATGVDRRTLVRHAITFAVAASLVILPVLVANGLRSDQFLLRKQIGANLYIGNDPELLGSNVELEAGVSWSEFASIPRRALGRTDALTESELNRFYVEATLRRAARDPITWMGLILGKSLSIATGREWLRSEDVYFYEHHVRGQLVSLVSTPLLFCLAFAGLALSLRERRRFALLHAFLLAVAFTVFFATKTRYLMPYVPVFAVFAGHAVSEVVRGLRAQRFAASTKVIAWFGLGVSIWALNPLAIARPDQSEALYAIADRYRLFRQPATALEYYERAIALDPGNPSIHHDLAAMLEVQGDLERAWREVNLARALAPPGQVTIDCAWRRIAGKLGQSPVDRAP